MKIWIIVFENKEKEREKRKGKGVELKKSILRLRKKGFFLSFPKQTDAFTVLNFTT